MRLRLFWSKLKYKIWRIFHKSTLPTDPVEALLDLIPTLMAVGVVMGAMNAIMKPFRLAQLDREIQTTAFHLKPNWIWRNFSVQP